MVTMVKRLSRQFVALASRVQFPLVTPIIKNTLIKAVFFKKAVYRYNIPIENMYYKLDKFAQMAIEYPELTDKL